MTARGADVVRGGIERVLLDGRAVGMMRRCADGTWRASRIPGDARPGGKAHAERSPTRAAALAYIEAAPVGGGDYAEAEYLIRRAHFAAAELEAKG